MEEEKKIDREKVLAILTTFIIILVPTIGFNFTMGGHDIYETTYFWPWLILVFLKPTNSIFATEMYNFILPPYTLILFLPFLFALKLCYTQFHGEDEKDKTAGLIALMALIQILLIWITYQSQNPNSFVKEDTSMWYIPQILILLMQGFFGAKWYYAKVQDILKTPKSDKTD